MNLWVNMRGVSVSVDGNLSVMSRGQMEGDFHQGKHAWSFLCGGQCMNFNPGYSVWEWVLGHVAAWGFIRLFLAHSAKLQYFPHT